MTKQEAQLVIQYANFLYPRQKFADMGNEKASEFLASQFADATLDEVIAALRDASEYTPDWMPNIPRIQASLHTLRATRKKDEESAFRDAHCGKNRQEWEELRKWEQSESGKERLAQYRKQLRSFIAQIGRTDNGNA